MRLIYLYLESYCRYNYVACSHEISYMCLSCKGQKLIKLYVNDVLIRYATILKNAYNEALDFISKRVLSLVIRSHPLMCTSVSLGILLG